MLTFYLLFSNTSSTVLFVFQKEKKKSILPQADLEMLAKRTVLE